MKDKINIFGLYIQNLSYEEIISIVFEKIKIRERFMFHNINANILLTYCKSDTFKNFLNSFSALYSDGVGVFIASKILYGKNGLKNRITGTDLYYEILNLANKNGLKCFFYGGSKEAIKLLPETLRKKYPNINISGALSRDTIFKNDDYEKIKNSKADILFVGLGTPYQEEWIAENSKFVDIPVQMAVGSGIEFISGVKKRAPKIFRKIGLEWIYRIYLEPARLWKRYFLGIPIFIFKIIIFKIKLLINKQNNQI